MVESVDGQRVVLHDLVHAFARELVGQLARERHAAFSRLVDHLVPAARAAVEAADAPARQWLNLRRSLLVHLAAESAGNRRPDAAVDLAEILGEHLETVAAYADAIALHVPAAEAAAALGRIVAAAESRRRAGVAHYRLGQPDQARTTLDCAADAFRMAGDRVGEARTLMNIGSLCWRSGDLSDALTRYRAALGLYRTAGDQTGTANVLCNIGVIHVDAGDVDLGIRHYEEALSLYRRTGARRFEAITLGNLGAAHLKRARLEVARQTHADSARLARAVGDRGTEGIAFHNLGEVDLHLGRDRDARRHFLESLALAREIGDRLGEGLTLDYLGVLHRRRGDLPRAAGMHERALAIARETANRDGQCAALTNLARVALEQGRYDAVRTLTGEAAEIAGQLDSPERLGQALNVVADLCEADGSMVAALASRRRALACARRAHAVMDEAAALDGLAGHHAARGRLKLAARHRRGVEAIRTAVSAHGSDGGGAADGSFARRRSP
jgi:tetratricopeptide (TPR) repeat protein